MGFAKTRPVLLLLAAALAGACDDSGGCRELCEKDDQCLGGVDVEACTATCVEQAESDEAYADAVAERASCVDGVACDELFFACWPNGE